MLGVLIGAVYGALAAVVVLGIAITRNVGEAKCAGSRVGHGSTPPPVPGAPFSSPERERLLAELGALDLELRRLTKPDARKAVARWH